MLQRVAVGEHALELGERRARRMRAQGEAHVVADEPDENARRRWREPAAACSVSMLNATASPGASAQPRIVCASRSASTSGTSSNVPSSNTSARSSKKLRGMYQVWLACDPATNSSVLSRGTGSSGIQNETVSEPSTL